MEEEEEVFCKNCDAVDEYSREFITSNNAIRLTCEYCGKFIKFQKYDDKDFRKAMADANFIIQQKKDAGDFKVDETKLRNRYSHVNTFALIHRLRKDWPEMKFKY